MSESVDIKDRESLKAWLEDQPREVAVWIASRAAARVLPPWWQAVMTEEWARDANLTAMAVLQSLLLSGVAAKRPTSITEKNADNAIFAVGQNDSAAGGPDAEGVDMGRLAICAAFALKAAFGRMFSESASFAVYANRATHDAAWESVRTDAAQANGGALPESLSLWADGKGPQAEKWRAIKWQIANSEDAQDWQFWIDWYDSLLDGRPMLGDSGRTWEMLEQIALIDPGTWDKGPEVVNPVIREIWELHRLRAEVAALQAEKAAFLAVRASEAQRGHNQPPEGLVDDAPEVARQITLIWDGLDEAREELERDAPDKSRLRAIAERILAALNVVVAYCGKVADKTVTSAAEAAGKLAGRAAVVAAIDQVANNGRLMQFAKDLLAFGGG